MINTVTLINRFLKSDAETFIKECENEYHNEIKNIAKLIAESKHLRIVMLAGPSGAGKTTTAHILRSYLTELGVSTQVVSLDHFYRDRDTLPVINGKIDAESVDALNLDEIKDCFGKIIATGKCYIPNFDFKNGKSIKNAELIDISKGGVMIVEGLHALNPAITSNLPKNSLYKVYISVNSPIKSSVGTELLSSRRIRLMRRAIRDERTRGADIFATLKMWSQVVAGEEKYLYPFKDTADKMLVTLHPYEPCVYKQKFLALMKGVDKSAENYEYAKSVVDALQFFDYLDEELIPYDSLIREFIGNGNFS